MNLKLYLFGEEDLRRDILFVLLNIRVLLLSMLLIVIGAGKQQQERQRSTGQHHQQVRLQAQHVGHGVLGGHAQLGQVLGHDLGVGL